MKQKQCDQERVLRDTKKHEMEVVQDSGVFRHIKYGVPGSSSYSFQITTFPGHLCFTGDMGCFVFERLHDMFNFFRNDKDDINPYYWHEKLVAVDRADGSQEYSQEKFIIQVKEYFRDWVIDNESEDIAEKREVWSEIKENVLSCGEFECEAHHAASDFSCNGFTFSDFWEVNLKEYTFRYIWCLYAIVWGIRKYDEFKTAKTTDGTD